MITGLTEILTRDFLQDVDLETIDHDNSTYDKSTRIEYVCANVNLKKFIKTVCDKVYETVNDQIKSDEKAAKLLKSAEHRFKLITTEREPIEKIVAILNKTIMISEYGSIVFVKAYQLRSKCHLKLHKMKEAHHDISVAIQFGGINKERAHIKTIVLFHLDDYVQFKSFIDETYELDDTLLAELDINGYQPVRKKDIYNFIKYGDPCLFPSEESGSGSSNSEEDDETDTGLLNNIIDPLLKMEHNYVLDERCKVAHDRKKGRHFLSKQFIPKGTQILAERAFSWALNHDPDVQTEYCSYCSEHIPSKFLPCKFCVDLVFCDEKCFEKAWMVFHRYECGIKPLFNDSLDISLHMYRQIAKIGYRQVFEIVKQFKELKENDLIIQRANDSSKNVEEYIEDFIIDEYMSDEELKKTVDCRQTKQQKIKTFQMLLTLLDHNEKFESYYDLCYMGISIDVTLMILLSDYLEQHANDPQNPHWQHINQKSLWKDLLKANQTKNHVKELDFFNHSFEEFKELVRIILISIRKLTTNVFSWNQYVEKIQSKKFLATCQCLIASLINHSCDPNIEWDFMNGCIVYTTTRDIEPNEEINNSYGPHSGMDFVKRQTMLANNYYFNCRCRLCQKEVNQYSNVLACLNCEGPVVVLPDTYIHHDCMLCWQKYNDAKMKMQLVNDSRRSLKILSHFFQKFSKKSSVLSDDEFCFLVNKLIHTIDFQLKHVYRGNSELQRDLMTLCKFFYQYGLVNYACHYGSYLYDQDKGDCLLESTTLLEVVENCLLWFEISKKYMKLNQGQQQNVCRQLIINYRCNLEKHIEELLEEYRQKEQEHEKTNVKQKDEQKDQLSFDYREFFKEILTNAITK